MPRINLIAERRSREKKQAAGARVMLYGCGCMAVAFLGVLMQTTWTIRTIDGEIESAKAEVIRLQPTLQEVTGVQNETKVLEPKLTLLESAKDSTMHWYLIFQQVGQGLPVTSWLDNLIISRDSKSGQDSVTLTGQSESAYSVADTIRQLNRQPMFGQVELHYMTQDDNAAPTTNAGASTVGQISHPVRFETLVQLKPQDQKNGQHTP